MQQPKINQMLPPELWKRVPLDFTSALRAGAAGISYYRPLLSAAYNVAQICSISQSEITPVLVLSDPPILESKPRRIQETGPFGPPVQPYPTERIEACTCLLNVALRVGISLHVNFKSKTALTALRSQLNPSLVIALSLIQMRIRDEEISSIADLLLKFNVTTVRFMANQIGDDGAQLIANVLPNSSVTYLDLSANRIEPYGAKAIADVLHCSPVTHLLLECNDLGEEGVSAIAASLPNSSITYLSLSQNDIQQAGAILIAHALSKSPLELLDLSLNDIDDDGAIAIAASLPHSRLQELKLGMNAIGYRGALAIIESLPSSLVTDVSLPGIDVEDEARHELVDLIDLLPEGIDVCIE